MLSPDDSTVKWECWRRPVEGGARNNVRVAGAHEQQRAMTEACEQSLCDGFPTGCPVSRRDASDARRREGVVSSTSRFLEFPSRHSSHDLIRCGASETSGRFLANHVWARANLHPCATRRLLYLPKGSSNRAFVVIESFPRISRTLRKAIPGINPGTRGFPS